jgi:hypothetical protein
VYRIRELAGMEWNDVWAPQVIKSLMSRAQKPNYLLTTELNLHADRKRTEFVLSQLYDAFPIDKLSLRIKAINTFKA